MRQQLEDFREGYAAALEHYLHHRGEADLCAGYELGRRALAEGFGLLETTTIHQEALGQIAAREPGDRTGLDRDAWKFLQEVIASFEMILQGYRELNAALARTNGELEQRADAVEVLNQELEAFSYSVSHDLRAPLRSIDGFARALEEDCGAQLDEHGRRHVKRVRTAARRMSCLIDDLLGLATVTRGELDHTKVDLSAIAGVVVSRLRAADPERTVEVAIAPGLQVNGDKGLLEIVLANLIGNAWKFTSKRPDAQIEIGRCTEDGRAVYFVEDNGAGFEMSEAGKLFAPFQRLHPTAEFDGNGIGLAMVQRIVRRHGGRVWATAAPQHGTRLSFTLNGTGDGLGRPP